MNDIDHAINSKYQLPDCGFEAPKGMIFAGWQINDDSSSLKAAGDTIEVIDDVTLVASWDEPVVKPEPSTPDEPKMVGVMGDIDNDGSIDSLDALFVLRMSVGIEKITETNKAIADVDLDGKVSSADALDILRSSVGYNDNKNVGKQVKK